MPGEILRRLGVEAGYGKGMKAERARLRPLLEQALNALLSSVSGNPRLREMAIANLRDELGKEG